MIIKSLERGRLPAGGSLSLFRWSGASSRHGRPRWPRAKVMWCVGGSDRLAVCVFLRLPSLSNRPHVWASRADHKNDVSRVGDLRFFGGGSGGGVRRGEKKRGKKKSATGASPRAAMIQLSVSSCHSRPEQLWKHRKDQEEGEEERQSQILLC